MKKSKTLPFAYESSNKQSCYFQDIGKLMMQVMCAGALETCYQIARPFPTVVSNNRAFVVLGRHFRNSD